MEEGGEEAGREEGGESWNIALISTLCSTHTRALHAACRRRVSKHHLKINHCIGALPRRHLTRIAKSTAPTRRDADSTFQPTPLTRLPAPPAALHLPMPSSPCHRCGTGQGQPQISSVFFSCIAFRLCRTLITAVDSNRYARNSADIIACANVEHCAWLLAVLHRR